MKTIPKSAIYFLAGLLSSVVVYEGVIRLGIMPLHEESHESTLVLAQEAKVRLVLNEQWKLNDQAPSQLGVYLKSGDAWNLAQEVSGDHIKRLEFKLPRLESGSEYQLRGTLYSCQRENAKVCSMSRVQKGFSIAFPGQSAESNLDLEVKSD